MIGSYILKATPMPSPFPGMDPFLEAHWGDVHTSLAVAIRNDLQHRLPDSLVARVEESVLLEVVAFESVVIPVLLRVPAISN